MVSDGFLYPVVATVGLLFVKGRAARSKHSMAESTGCPDQLVQEVHANATLLQPRTSTPTSLAIPVLLLAATRLAPAALHLAHVPH
jgi:hypothetical protein